MSAATPIPAPTVARHPVHPHPGPALAPAAAAERVSHMEDQSPSFTTRRRGNPLNRITRPKFNVTIAELWFWRLAIPALIAAAIFR